MYKRNTADIYSKYCEYKMCAEIQWIMNKDICLISTPECVV